MKIELDLNTEGYNVVRAYSEGKITVSDTEYVSSLILAPHEIIDDWPPQNFSDLESDHFRGIISMEPELVIVGTGKRLQFPTAEVLAPLSNRQIGFEIMDTGAACRSYNFLVGEGRKVVAALLMIEV